MFNLLRELSGFLGKDAQNQKNTNWSTIEDALNNLQGQISQLVVHGDSSPQASQASVGADGTDYAGDLKERLDTEYNQISAQLLELSNSETQYNQAMADVEASYIKKSGIGVAHGYYGSQSFNAGFFVFPAMTYLVELDSDIFNVPTGEASSLHFTQGGLYLVHLEMERSDLPADQHWAIGFSINDDQTKMWVTNILSGDYGWSRAVGPNQSQIANQVTKVIRVNANDYINFNCASDDGPRNYIDIKWHVIRIGD